MWRDDQTPLTPWFARAVGAQELRNGCDRRLHRKDVEPDTCEMPALQEVGERIDVDDRSPRGVYHHASFRHAFQHGLRDHAARLWRQRCMDRQRVGLLHQPLERVHPFDAYAEFSAVWHVRVIGNDAKLESLRPQRRRRADAAQTDNAESLYAIAPEKRVAHIGPRCGLRSPLRLKVERDAAAERQSKCQRVVGHLGSAVVRHIAHHHLVRGSCLSIDLVVADTHAHHAGELGESREVFGGHRVPHHHQAVNLAAVVLFEL